ncbi:MAG: TrkH family potassium uptake protein [Candidatus Hydrothermarchaeales archaeon]
MIGVLTTEDFRVILSNLGKVVGIVSPVFLVPLIAVYYYGELEYIWDFVLPFLLALVLAAALMFLFRTEQEMRIRHAVALTAISYLVFSFLGAIPILKVSPTFLDALFESVSGWSTTGLSTIAANADTFPHSINLWRHLMQYIGGLGIVVMSLVVLSRAGTGVESTVFYTAEGRTERIGASIVSTVRSLLSIYVVFFVFGAIALNLFGMTWFDAICHSMAGFSTGGFSTHAESIGFFRSNSLELITLIIMVMGATNFALYYVLIRGRINELWKNLEIRIFAILLGALALPTILWLNKEAYPASEGFRLGFYQITSALTTTGWMTEPSGKMATLWAPFALGLTALAMSIGASTGSTGGGIKRMRFGLLLKSIRWKVQETLSPEAAVIVKKFHHIEDRILEDNTMNDIFIMVSAYGVLLVLSTLITAAYGYSLGDSFFEASSALGTIGMSSGITGLGMPGALKVVFMIDMWAGRLEVLPVLVFLASLKGLIMR